MSNVKGKIITLLIVVILAIIGFLAIKQVMNLSYKIKNLKTNLIEIENENSNLVFANGELKNYLDVLNSREKRLIDSVANIYEIKIKKIKQAQVVHLVYVDTIFHDSTIVKYETAVKQNDSVFDIPFSVDKDCYSLDGSIISQDSTSKVEFERVEFIDDIVYIKYTKRKWYQFWLWFTKPRPESISIGRCGNVTFKNFEEKD